MRPADPFGDVIRPGDGFDTTRTGDALGSPGSEEAFSVGRATSPPSALAWQSTLGHRAVASLGLNTGGVTEPVEPSTPDPTAGAARRVGDAERDKAAEYLREHMAAGRLDAAEFDERLTRALSAKMGPDLDALFTDLPDPRPGTAMVPTEPFQAPPWQSEPPAASGSQLTTPPSAKPPSSAQRNFAVVTATAWTLAIIFCFATSWQNWWILFIPIFLSWGMKRRQP
jgi:hypothetical protein